jgi:hypothetical protein
MNDLFFRHFHLVVGLVAAAFIASPATIVAQTTEDDSSDVERREAEMFGESGGDEATAESDDTSGDDSDDSESPESQNESEAREDAMFGGSDEGDEADDGLVTDASTEDRIAERLADRDDTLAIGGTYFGRLQYSIFGEGDPESFPLSQPNILDLYLDARPRDRLRLFTQGRLSFDPTVRPGERTRFGGRTDRLEVELDQLWLKFDVARQLYVTIGRQKVRWGVGRFWFPNDFLRTQRRDPVAIFDERTGVDLVRLHWPIPSLNWNLYAVANVSGATSPEEVGGALRSEVLIGQTEWALSAAYRKDRPLRLGFDVSTGIWEFDLRGAVSVARGVDSTFYRGSFDVETLARPNPLNWQLPEEYSRSDEWIPRALAGAEVAISYGGDDVLLVGGEYFFNGFGYDDPDLYPWLIFQEAFRPFYVGRHYGGLYAALPSPGRWEEGSVTLSTLGNLSDRSFLTRLDLRTTIFEDLQYYVFGSVTYGQRGEFKLRIDLPPIPAASGRETPIDVSNGLEVPALRGQVGMGFQLAY